MSETQTRRVREIIEIITLTLLTLFIIRSAVQSFRTDGQSMEPNFHTDEYVPTVSVNNQTIIEPYIRVAFNFDNTSWKLGPKQFFVMGDNRDGSLDSRTWGPLDRSYIIGKVVAAYCPFNDLGLVNTYPDVYATIRP